MTTKPRRKGMRLEACRSAYQPHIAKENRRQLIRRPMCRTEEEKAYGLRLSLRLHRQQEEQQPSTALHEGYGT